MGVGYTTEGSVCRQVRHLGILPQHGVQINRDYNDKKGHPRVVTEILPFSFLKTKQNKTNNKKNPEQITTPKEPKHNPPHTH